MPSPLCLCTDQSWDVKEEMGKNYNWKLLFFLHFCFFLFNKNSNQAQAQKFDCISNVEETSNCQTSEAGFELAVAPYVGGGISFFKVWKVFTNLQLHYFFTSSPFISLNWGLISPWLVTKQKILDRNGPIVSKTPWAIKKRHVWACQRIAHLNIFESGFNLQEGGLILKQTMPRCRRSHRISFSWSRKFGLGKTQARNERLRNTCGWNARWRRHFLNVVQYQCSAQWRSNTSDSLT